MPKAKKKRTRPRISDRMDALRVDYERLSKKQYNADDLSFRLSKSLSNTNAIVLSHDRAIGAMGMQIPGGLDELRRTVELLNKRQQEYDCRDQRPAVADLSQLTKSLNHRLTNLENAKSTGASLKHRVDRHEIDLMKLLDRVTALEGKHDRSILTRASRAWRSFWRRFRPPE